MQNWDRNLQDVKFKQKLNNIRSTLPKISSANNASSSLISKKQITEKSSSNLNNLENLYINVTNKMKQLTSSPGKTTNVNTHQKKKNTEMKQQNYLKHLLNEFGLSQYLRKLYELGYDDNNINKIGLMSRKKFQELVINMKMYPGQSVKMEKLYDYLKQLNLANTMYNTRLMQGKNNKVKNNINNKKQFNSEVNKRRIKTASGYNNLINNNNNMNSNTFGNYSGSTYLNNKNSNTNLNMNNNGERPKTTTNKKIKPIQKTPSSYTSTNNNKTKSKTIDNNINNYAILTPGYYLSNNKSNYTNAKSNSNDILLNSFKKGDLGYGFYMNNNYNNYKNSNNMIEDSKNQKQSPVNYFNEELISQNDCRDYSKLENINLNKYNTNIKSNNEGELIEEKMTEDIDNMLKYYMVQLNEKLDDSYGTVEDSSLSYNVSIPINELNKKQNKINLENEDKINIDKNKNSGKLKLPSLNDKQNNTKKEQEIKNKEINKIKEEDKNKKEVINNDIKKDIKENKKDNINNNIKEKEIINEITDNKNITNKETTNIYNNNDAKIFSDQNNESTKNININLKAEQNKNDSSIEDINLDDLDKEEEQEKEKENHIKEENTNININNEETKNNIIENNNNKNDNNIKQQEKEKEKIADIDENIEVVEEDKNDNENNQEIKYGFNGEKVDSNEKPNSPQTQTQNERYSLEENIYDNLRLTKSMGGEYLHQNMEKFDIEYMCRCLSLAIMKLLESSKGKQHITDLMDKENEKFEFFNNFFNSNYNIISDFFGKNKENIDNNENKENNDNIYNKMSNLEKLELQQNKLINDKEDISLLKHLRRDIDEKLIKEQEIKNKQFKLKNNLADIEKDIRFIDEFFSMNRQRTKNYKGLTDKTKSIMCKELSYINEVDSEVNNTKTNSMISNLEKNNNNSKQNIIEEEKKDNEDNYENEFVDIDIDNKKNENEININNEMNNKFSSISVINNKDSIKLVEKKEKENNKNEKTENKDDINTNLKIDEIIKNNNEQIKEELPQIQNNLTNKELIESGSMESDYIIDINTMDKFKTYLLKQAEVFDDDFIYSAMHIPTRKYVPPPDPQVIFEFCANIMILTKMEKEVIIITLLYLERFIFNTGLLLTSRNWRRIIFTTMAIASKIWDDDSFENNHFAQVFKHLSIGEINLLERTFLDMINYKVYVKCSEYFKYFFIIKSIALKYNYNGVEMIPISVERMMKIQEYAYQMQKRVKKKIGLSNSTNF